MGEALRLDMQLTKKRTGSSRSRKANRNGASHSPSGYLLSCSIWPRIDGRCRGRRSVRRSSSPRRIRCSVRYRRRTSLENNGSASTLLKCQFGHDTVSTYADTTASHDRRLGERDQPPRNRFNCSSNSGMQVCAPMPAARSTSTPVRRRCLFWVERFPSRT
jgi:hypothetical protein